MRRAAIRASEKAIQAAVVEHWRVLGHADTLVAAIPNQNAHGQPGLTPGLPDLLVLGPSLPGGVGFIELKRGLEPLSDAQLNFATLCARLDISWSIARGRDQPIAILEAWGVVKRAAA